MSSLQALVRSCFLLPAKREPPRCRSYRLWWDLVSCCLPKGNLQDVVFTGFGEILFLVACQKGTSKMSSLQALVRSCFLLPANREPPRCRPYRIWWGIIFGCLHGHIVSVENVLSFFFGLWVVKRTVTLKRKCNITTNTKITRAYDNHTDYHQRFVYIIRMFVKLTRNAWELVYKCSRTLWHMSEQLIHLLCCIFLRFLPWEFWVPFCEDS